MCQYVISMELKTMRCEVKQRRKRWEQAQNNGCSPSTLTDLLEEQPAVETRKGSEGGEGKAASKMQNKQLQDEESAEPCERGGTADLAN